MQDYWNYRAGTKQENCSGAYNYLQIDYFGVFFEGKSCKTDRLNPRFSKPKTYTLLWSPDQMSCDPSFPFANFKGVYGTGPIFSRIPEQVTSYVLQLGSKPRIIKT